jgi:hypothetical protein
MLLTVIVAEILRWYRRSIQKEYQYYATPAPYWLYAQCTRSGRLGIDSTRSGVSHDTVCNSWFDAGALARSAIGLVCSSGLLAFRPSLLRIGRRAIGHLALTGMVSIGIYHALWLWSVTLNGAAIAVVLIYTYPAQVRCIWRCWHWCWWGVRSSSVRTILQSCGSAGWAR